MADNLQIFTAFDISTVPVQPSLDCVQWSGDGQIFVVNKFVVYILVGFIVPLRLQFPVMNLRNCRHQIWG